jgi:hypothetical protein
LQSSFVSFDAETCSLFYVIFWGEYGYLEKRYVPVFSFHAYEPETSLLFLPMYSDKREEKSRINSQDFNNISIFL